jgi:hypothetical protein
MVFLPENLRHLRTGFAPAQDVHQLVVTEGVYRPLAQACFVAVEGFGKRPAEDRVVSIRIKVCELTN